MEATIFPLEKGRSNTIRSAVDRMLCQGDTAFNQKMGCSLTKYTQGNTAVFIAGRSNRGRELKAAHIIVCGDFEKNEKNSKQAALVGTTYSGNSKEKMQDISLLTVVGQLFIKHGYALCAENSCLPTDKEFGACGFTDRVQSGSLLNKKMKEIFNDQGPYCQQINCWQRQACLMHPALYENYFAFSIKKS